MKKPATEKRSVIQIEREVAAIISIITGIAIFFEPKILPYVVALVLIIFGVFLLVQK